MLELHRQATNEVISGGHGLRLPGVCINEAARATRCCVSRCIRLAVWIRSRTHEHAAAGVDALRRGVLHQAGQRRPEITVTHRGASAAAHAAAVRRKKRKRGVGHPQMSGWDRQLPKYMEKKEKVRWKETDGDGWTDKWKQSKKVFIVICDHRIQHLSVVI